MKRSATCHPNRYHAAKGLCANCYAARMYKKHESAYKRSMRRGHLKRKFNLSVDDYEYLYQQQHGLCAICSSPPNEKSFMVDHDHSTKQIRGLLCRRCNLLLGYGKDNPVLLEEAAKYLRKHANT